MNREACHSGSSDSVFCGPTWNNYSFSNILTLEKIGPSRWMDGTMAQSVGWTEQASSLRMLSWVCPSFPWHVSFLHSPIIKRITVQQVPAEYANLPRLDGHVLSEKHWTGWNHWQIGEAKFKGWRIKPCWCRIPCKVLQFLWFENLKTVGYRSVFKALHKAS